MRFSHHQLLVIDVAGACDRNLVWLGLAEHCPASIASQLVVVDSDIPPVRSCRRGGLSVRFR